MGRSIDRESWPNYAASTGGFGELHGDTEKVRAYPRLHSCTSPFKQVQTRKTHVIFILTRSLPSCPVFVQYPLAPEQGTTLQIH